MESGGHRVLGTTKFGEENYMEPSIEVIRSSLDSFIGSTRRTAQKYPPDERKEILVRLLSQLCECVMTHVELMGSEHKDRFLISELDYHELLEKYLIVFRQIRKLPRASPKSIYEISLISDIDTILKSHCEGEKVE
jgi:hypothetical protein